jgi:hypothetical protein
MGNPLGTEFQIPIELAGQEFVTFGVNINNDTAAPFGTFNTFIQSLRVDPPPPQANLSLVGRNTVDIQSLQGQVTSLGSTVGTLQENVNTVSNNVTTLDSTVGTLSTSVGTLSTSVTTLDSTVGTLSTSVTTLSTDVGTLSTSVTTASDNAATALAAAQSLASTKISIVGNAIIELPAAGGAYEGDLNDWLQAENPENGGVVGVGPSSLLIVSSFTEDPIQQITVPYYTGVDEEVGAMYRICCASSSDFGVSLLFTGNGTIENPDYLVGLLPGQCVGIIRIAGSYVQVDGF